MRRDAHLHPTVDRPRRALRVKRNEVKRRAFLPGGMVGFAQAMLEEAARELSAVSRGIGPAHARLGQRFAHARDRVVVQLVEILRRAVPVGGPVGLVHREEREALAEQALVGGGIGRHGAWRRRGVVIAEP